MDCSLPGSSLHGILQARILGWVAFSFSSGSSRLRDRTWVSCTASVGSLLFPWSCPSLHEMFPWYLQLSWRDLCCCCCCCCCISSVVPNSVRPHRRQPTRLLHPWHSPGKNTGGGCHFLLQGMHVKSLQSCLTLCDPMDSSPPGSSVHGILQARILEWVAIAFSEEISSLSQFIGLTETNKQTIEQPRKIR